MTEDNKPSRFEELMRRMGQTKQFPIDLQPVNPAVPFPMAMRKALAGETGLSEADRRQLAPGFLDGDTEPLDQAEALLRQTTRRRTDFSRAHARDGFP